MSAILGFDTATAAVAVAVCEEGEELASFAGPGSKGHPRHGVELMGAIEDCVGRAGGWERITRIAVGIGPGGYTGLRIGIATARAIASVRGLEIVGVQSTEALAAAALRAGAGPVAAVLDARRGEVFAALHADPATATWGPEVLAPADLAARLAAADQWVLAVGDGSVRFRGELEADGGVRIPEEADPLHRLDARETCALGSEAEPVAVTAVTPLYLRQPDARRWLERDHGSDDTDS